MLRLTNFMLYGFLLIWSSGTYSCLALMDCPPFKLTEMHNLGRCY